MHDEVVVDLLAEAEVGERSLAAAGRAARLRRLRGIVLVLVLPLGVTEVAEVGLRLPDRTAQQRVGEQHEPLGEPG